MGLKPSPEDLARALDDAGGLRLIRTRYTGHRNQAVLTFDWQGKPLQFTVAITEVLGGEVPQNTRNRSTDERNPGRIAHLVKGKAHWTEDECRREGLPLYHSETWLRDALKRLGSQAEIQRVYGYSNQILSRRLLALGIETRPRTTEQQRERARFLRRTTTLSLEKIAAETGLSKPSVSRACRGIQPPDA